MAAVNDQRDDFEQTSKDLAEVEHQRQGDDPVSPAASLERGRGATAECSPPPLTPLLELARAVEREDDKLTANPEWCKVCEEHAEVIRPFAEAVLALLSEIYRQEQVLDRG